MIDGNLQIVIYIFLLGLNKMYNFGKNKEKQNLSLA